MPTDVLNLLITYSPTYPDELPEIGLEVLEGELNDEEQQQLITGLQAAGNDSLGMVSSCTRSLPPSSPCFSPHFDPLRPNTVSALTDFELCADASTLTGHGLHPITLLARFTR